MASPMRLGSALIAAAEREAAIQKRSVPKQIEFWAELGMAVERTIGFDDVVAVTQGLKRIELESLVSPAVDAAEVFGDLESRRTGGSLPGSVTSAAITYEASRSRPGFLDRVNSASGKRETGRFRNGAFTTCR
ncbi:MAG: TA system antitoxin ParD family protein [Candidatus Methylomirabilia bacterium]